MRQLFIQVPRGHGDEVLRIAEEHDGINLARMEATDHERRLDVVLVHVSNQRVGAFIERVQELEEMRMVLLPQGIIALQPPVEQAAQQAIDIEPKSAFEIFFAGLQSIGSWQGFIGYAVAASLVVWTGLFTNGVYLLVAAMLIAPYAGPAMLVAMGTARGDLGLVRRGVVRYLVALVITVTINAAMSWLMGQSVATAQMVSVSEISSVSVLLPLAAGAAGALNLAQSERNSLVSGAAVGMLIAASLAPPAGLVGMAAALGEWGMVKSGVFLLTLQLLVINLSGAAIFRLYGLSASGARYERGHPRAGWAVAAATLALLGGVLWWQFSSTPELQRSSRAQKATEEVKTAVTQSGLARLVEANVRFTRADIPGQDTLLARVYVQAGEGSGLSDEEIRTRLTRAIQTRLLEQGYNVTPLVDVSVLRPPWQ